MFLFLFCLLLAINEVDGCRKHSSRRMRYGKPPTVVFRKSRKFPSFNKLQLVLDYKELKKNERYSSSEYRKLISDGDIVQEANGDFTKITAIGIQKTGGGSLSSILVGGKGIGGGETEVIWMFEKFHSQTENDNNPNMNLWPMGPGSDKALVCRGSGAKGNGAPQPRDDGTLRLLGLEATG